MSVQLKSEIDIVGMREAGRLASELLDHLTPLVTSGVTHRAIDHAAPDHLLTVRHPEPPPCTPRRGGHRVPELTPTERTKPEPDWNTIPDGLAPAVLIADAGMVTTNDWGTAVWS